MSKKSFNRNNFTSSSFTPTRLDKKSDTPNAEDPEIDEIESDDDTKEPEQESPTSENDFTPISSPPTPLSRMVQTESQSQNPVTQKISDHLIEKKLFGLKQQQPNSTYKLVTPEVELFYSNTNGLLSRIIHDLKQLSIHHTVISKVEQTRLLMMIKIISRDDVLYKDNLNGIKIILVSKK